MLTTYRISILASLISSMTVSHTWHKLHTCLAFLAPLLETSA